MIVYRHEGRWFKPGQQPKSAEKHDTGANADAFVQWLNDTCTLDPPEASEAWLDRATVRLPEQQATVDLLEQWIMDTATQAEVERIFTALGVRFGEARK